MYADSRHYREYQQMLVDLHTMISDGNGDSDESMDLRERMEEPERHLSELEVSRLNALSGDLSMLHDREIPDMSVVARVTASELPRSLINAHQRRDWDELLALLRADVSSIFEKSQVAYLRSRAYEAMNELAPAIAFMDEAARRDPTNANYRALALELLWKNQRYDEAYARAKRYLGDRATHDRLVLIAAGVLSRLNRQDHPPRDLATTILNSLDYIERAAPREPFPAIRFSGFATLGLLAVDVEEDARGVRALKRALEETDAASHFVIRGLLLRELEMVESQRSRTVEERSLSRELADAVAPRVEGSYALAA